MLVGPSKQLEEIIQIEHNTFKNPNWPEADQLAIYKRNRGFELGATVKQIQVVARAGLEPGTALTTRPGCFLVHLLRRNAGYFGITIFVIKIVLFGYLVTAFPFMKK